MALFIPKDRKSLFRQFLAGMYDAVVITDPNGYILEVNPRTVEYFGHEADETLDKPISLLIPGLKQEIVARIRRGLAGDRHVIIDANAVAKDGRKIACEVAVSSIDLMNPGDLIFTIRNVERRRDYLNGLWTKANAFQLSQSALYACDPDGKITVCNDAFAKLFGLKDAEAARGRAIADFLKDGSGYAVETAPDVHGKKTVGTVGSILKS